MLHLESVSTSHPTHAFSKKHKEQQELSKTLEVFFFPLKALKPDKKKKRKSTDKNLDDISITACLQDRNICVCERDKWSWLFEAPLALVIRPPAPHPKGEKHLLLTLRSRLQIRSMFKILSL